MGEMTMIDRIPPNSLPAESAVLGAMLVDAELIPTVEMIVKPEDFYSSGNETIFRAITELHEREAPIDKVAVAEQLRVHGMLEKIGGIPTLSRLMEVVPSLSSAEYYATLVAEKARLRRLIHAGSTITRLGYEGEDDAPAALAQAEHELAKVTSDGIAMTIEPVFAVMEWLNRQHLAGERERAFYTPWAQVNRLLGGFMGGELIAWVAAQAMGKSGVVSMLADYTAERHAAVLLGAENGTPRSVQRLLALRTGISARAQRLGKLTEAEREKLEAASEHYRGRPFYVFGPETASLAALWRALRMVAREAQIGCIIVDHAGKLRDVREERGKLSKHERLSNAYEVLIEMAQEFKCPMHVVQHFNRDGQRGEPSLESLGKIRDGGNIEGHADAIIFPWRENPIGTDDERERGKFIVAKSRDGVGGEVAMRYFGHRNMWVQADDPYPWFEPRIFAEPEPELDLDTFAI